MTTLFGEISLSGLFNSAKRQPPFLRFLRLFVTRKENFRPLKDKFEGRIINLGQFDFQGKKALKICLIPTTTLVAVIGLLMLIVDPTTQPFSVHGLKTLNFSVFTSLLTWLQTGSS